MHPFSNSHDTWKATKVQYSIRKEMLWWDIHKWQVAPDPVQNLPLLFPESVYTESFPRDNLKSHLSRVSLLPFPKDPARLCATLSIPYRIHPDFTLEVWSVRSFRENVLLNQETFLLLIFVGDLEMIVNVISSISRWHELKLRHRI